MQQIWSAFSPLVFTVPTLICFASVKLKWFITDSLAAAGPSSSQKVAYWSQWYLLWVALDLCPFWTITEICNGVANKGAIKFNYRVKKGGTKTVWRHCSHARERLHARSAAGGCWCEKMIVVCWGCHSSLELQWTASRRGTFTKWKLLHFMDRWQASPIIEAEHQNEAP